MNKFIFNADDFAKDIYHNDAILTGNQKGLINSASIMVTDEEAYKDAVEQIIPRSKNLMVGIHLNIVEGKPINKDLKLLTDKKGNFNNSFFSLLLKSANEEFLKEIEKEFRSQIEKAKQDVELYHINSHVHIHSIPAIFEITAKLAEEYNIPVIRTQKEIPYKIKEKFSIKKYLINMLKVLILNYFTVINKQFLTKYNVQTNDYIIGIGYSLMMNKETVLEGLRNIRRQDCLIECLVHPSKNIQNSERYNEYKIFLEEDLKERIENLGFELIQPKPKEEEKEEIQKENIEEIV